MSILGSPPSPVRDEAALAPFWLTVLRGLRREPLLDPRGPSAPQPGTEPLPPTVLATMRRLAGDDPVGLQLLVVGAVRAVLAAFGARERVGVLCPVPAGEVLLSTPLTPRQPVSVLLDGLVRDLQTAIPRAWTDRGALAARLDAIGSAEGAALSQLAVAWGETGAGLAPGGPVEILVHGKVGAAGAHIRVSGAGGRVPVAVRSLARCVVAALAAIVADPHRRLAELDVLGPEQRGELRRLGGIPPPAAFEPRTLVDLADDAAARHPDRVAVLDRDTSWTHAELAGRSRRAGAWLAGEHGVGRGEKVAVLLPRSPALVLAFVAVLRAGAAIVPIDPDHPAHRVRYLIERGGARVLIGDASPPDLGAVVIPTSALLDASTGTGAAGLPSRHPDDSPRPDDDALVFFTSGTTGPPRPAALRHDQMRHKAHSALAMLGIDAETRFPLMSAISSDATAYQIFVALAAGGSVAALGAPERLAAHEFWNLVHRHGITSLNCVPSLLSALLEALDEDTELPLRHLILGGDRVPSGLLSRTRGRLVIGTVANLYGPSEATVEAVSFVCPGERASDLHAVPIGVPSPGFAVAVVDARGDLAPVGVTGELYIAGPGVAVGYLGDPEATARRFVECPVPGAGRSFRTGDLARWSAEGTLEFIGRADAQIKINGNRVEPGELEQAVVSWVPGVREAVVVARRGRDGACSLVAWYTADSDIGSVTSVRARLAEVVPGYLVPAVLCPLARMPLTPHGKIDRAALESYPLPDDERRWEPADAVERTVAEMWTRVLGREPRAADEDFFDAGGHSLTAMALVAQLHRGADIDAEAVTVRQVFAARTPARLTRLLRDALRRRHQRPVSPVVAPTQYPGDGRHRCPATNAQRRMWLLESLDDEDTRSYTMVEAYELDERVSPAALREALGALARRHEALRTTFAVDAEAQRLDQVVAPATRETGDALDATVFVEVIDVADGAMPAVLAATAAREQRHRFDLQRGPLWRVHYLLGATGAGILVFTVHHAVNDGWSFAVVLRDLLELVRAARHGEPARLPEPIGYTEHSRRLARGLEGAAGREHARFWRRELAQLPEPTPLPSDRRQPPVRGNAGGLVEVPVLAGTARAVRRLVAEHDATPFMVCVAALRVLAHRLVGDTDYPLGAVVAGRSMPGLADEVGLFVNTVVLRTALDPAASFRSLLDRVRDTALAVQEHEEYPFELVVNDLARPREAGRNPLFDVLVTMAITGTSPVDLDGRGTGARLLRLEQDSASFDLAVSVALPPRDDAAGTVWLSFRTDCFGREFVARLGEQLVTVLDDLVRSPERPVTEARLLPAPQRWHLLREMNPAFRPGPECSLLDALSIGGRDPGAVVVRSGEVTLTRAELAARAAGLAERLRGAAPVGPDALVAVLADRDEYLPVSLLGVLRAGAAVLPLDLDQPEQRLRELVRDSGAVAALGPPERLRPLAGLPGLALLDPRGGNSGTPGTPTDHVRPGQLAYALYTSGSTGRPKGVLVEHRSIAAIVTHRVRHLRLGPGSVMLQCLPAHFDAGLCDLLTGLVAGATLVIAPAGQLLDVAGLAARIERWRVNHLTIPPTVLELLLARERPGLRSLRTVVTGGSAMSVPLAARHLDVLPGCELHYEYGLTETAVVASSHRVDALEPGADTVPIGRPLPGQIIDLLDERGELVPLGAPGEICISGVGLARGYLGAQPDGEGAFTAHPIRLGTRMYRTGDLARWLPEGTLEFLGRRDDQVKIRGHRVEPGEVAAALATASGVERCAVIAERGTDGHNRLVAYVVGDAPAAALRRHLSALLPSAFVPAVFVRLETLPIGPNGKLDPTRLPFPPAAPTQNGADGSAGGGLGAAVAEIWRRALGFAVTDPNANLFEIGGHSMTAALIVDAVRERFSVTVPLRAIFEHQTLRAFTDCVRELASQRGRERPPPSTTPGAARIPATATQRRLWLAARGGRRTAHNITAVAEPARRLDPALLRPALRSLTWRHPALRTRFEFVPHEAALYLDVARHPPETPHTLAVREVDGMVWGDRPRLERLAAEAHRYEFEPDRHALWRVEQIRGSTGPDALIVTAHHLVWDIESLDVFLADLLEAYDDHAAGRLVPCEAGARTFLDWVVDEQRWLASPGAAESMAYWARRLAAPLARLELPSAAPRPARRSLATRLARREVDPARVAAARATLDGLAVTPFMLVVAAFAAALRRAATVSDILIGFPIVAFNRPAQIGCFVNELPLRLEVERSTTRRALLSHVRERALEAYEHGRIPIDRLIGELRPPRLPGRQVFFDVGVSWEGSRPAPGAAEAVRVARELFDPAPFIADDLRLYAREDHDGTLVVALVCDVALFDDAFARRLLDDVVAEIERLPSLIDEPVAVHASAQTDQAKSS